MLSQPNYFALKAMTGPLNPSDAATLYFGQTPTFGGIATAGLNREVMQRRGRIVGATLSVLVAGTLGTTEDATVAIRVNNTTDYTVTAAAKFNAAGQYYTVALDVVLNPTDYFEWKVVTPTWATNPTTVCLAGTAWLQAL